MGNKQCTPIPPPIPPPPPPPPVQVQEPFPSQTQDAKLTTDDVKELERIVKKGKYSDFMPWGLSKLDKLKNAYANPASLIPTFISTMLKGKGFGRKRVSNRRVSKKRVSKRRISKKRVSRKRISLRLSKRMSKKRVSKKF